jgi:peptidoglycan/xylan/chitin deacetylase (PgdA/CDA1 family)
MTAEIIAGEVRGSPARWRPSPTVAGSIGLHCLAGAGAVFNPEAWNWALGAVAANHAMLTAVGMWPRSSWLGPNVTRLPAAAAARSEISLTFDDGPDPDVTPKVLDILEGRGAHATFFCIGERSREHADLCREIVRRGHGIENHSRRHLSRFATLGMGGIRSEIRAAQACIVEATGFTPRFFRPPAGLRSPLLDPVLHELGLRHVSWTRRGFDTRHQTEAVTAKLVHGLGAGDILLLHDGQCARTPSGIPVVLEVLPRVLDAAAAARLRPVTLHHAIDS